MPLHILHVLSSNFYAGSVAYAVQLAERQVFEGHKVIMVTDSDCLSDKFICIALPVSKRTLLQRFRNIRFLKKIIRQYSINIVHAHSRAASWVVYYALRGTTVPLVSTIHGRQVKHSPAKKTDVYGNRVIAICNNLITHLTNEIQIDKQKLIQIPNSIDTDCLKQIKRKRTSDELTIISIVGRFNGPKGENIAQLVKYVFPDLLQQFPSLVIQLIGGEWGSFPMEGKSAYEELEKKYSGRIKNIGFTSEALQLMADSDLIIGAGRVALEGLFLNIPVFAMGEACCHGILSKSNIKEAISSNFGDILPVASFFRPDASQLLNELRAFLERKLEIEDKFSDLLSHYNLDRVNSEILKTYRQAIMQKAHHGSIPVLMYHKVPDKPIDTQHRIFVTRSNFEKHLRFFKLRSLTSITFKEYLAFANGDKPLKEFPRKPIILTFDDGYADNYRNMLPLAQKYGFKGVLFLLGDFSVTANFWDAGEDTETNRLMNFEQKMAFVEKGWEIGAHTLTHSDLTKLNHDQIMYEITESRVQLEQALQTKVISFAYPFGTCDDRVKNIVKEAGFEFGISTDSGGLTIEDDRFEVFRVNMFPEENLVQLYKKTSRWYRAYYWRKRGK